MKERMAVSFKKADLNSLRESIARVFDILDLILIRVTLLGLAGAGAWALLHK